MKKIPTEADATSAATVNTAAVTMAARRDRITSGTSATSAGTARTP
jgi:hypothetical protein